MKHEEKHMADSVLIWSGGGGAKKWPFLTIFVRKKKSSKNREKIEAPTSLNIVSDSPSLIRLAAPSPFVERPLATHQYNVPLHHTVATHVACTAVNSSNNRRLRHRLRLQVLFPTPHRESTNNSTACCSRGKKGTQF